MAGRRVRIGCVVASWCVVASGLASSSLGALARKMKVSEASSFRESVLRDESSAIGSVLRAAEAGRLAKLEPAGVAEAFGQAKALGVVCEYHRKTPATLRVNKVAEYEIPDVEAVSGEVRAAGAACLALNMDARTGGCGPDDFEKAKAEQETARGDFPGPLPLCWMDLVVDEVQLAQAYVAGARCVTIDKRLAGDRWQALADAAEATYGLEVFVACRPDDLDDDVGDRTVLLVGCDVHTAVDLRPRIAGRAIAKIEAKPGQGLEEAEEAWLLRDAGYDAVWLSDVLYKFGVFSGKLFAAAPDSITSVIKAVRSKASSQFARASGAFSGRGEGAKEYLGDILM